MPGAGKGTQAGLLADGLGLAHVASGDLFRDHLSRETELGLLAQGYMKRGDLVPDDVTVGMVRERLREEDCRNGAILDGFPRTLSQAAALDDLLAALGEHISAVPLISVPDEVVIKRLTARRLCRSCGAVYNLISHLPQVPGVCDTCGGELYQRADDNPETVRNRLYVYYKETSPLVGYYFAKGLLKEVDGDQPIEAVQSELQAVIGAAAT